jgi:hypothetical protein
MIETAAFPAAVVVPSIVNVAITVSQSLSPTAYAVNAEPPTGTYW